MGLHKPRLTNEITKRRCRYLYRQYERGHLYNEKDIKPKIMTNLPARENEVDDLKEAFVEYIKEKYDMVICEECHSITSAWEYGEDGRIFCCCCRG